MTKIPERIRNFKINFKILGNYVNIGVALRVTPIIQALNTESDEALEERLKEGLQCADGERSSVYPFGFWQLKYAPTEFYNGTAAMILLAVRHGEDYVIGLMGYRRPETAWERIKYSFTTELPTKN